MMQAAGTATAAAPRAPTISGAGPIRLSARKSVFSPTSAIPSNIRNRATEVQVEAAAEGGIKRR